jgi:diaminopimelate epimerase
MRIPFTKYHGAGNDFVVIDFRHSPPPWDIPSFARCLCERRLGIGADGLLLLFPSAIADCKLRIFNSDGSEPSMCGNGIRCVVDFIQKKENRPSELKIETLHSVLKCRRNGAEIAVNLGVPKILHWPVELAQGTVFVLDTGVPHAVLFVDEISKVDVAKEGAAIRFHPQFAPRGVNVNFVSIDSEGQVMLRTYERGVEEETLACGTGAAATAFVSRKQRGLPSTISVLTRASFEKMDYHQSLEFQFCQNDQIEMIGKAEEVFEGFIFYE